MRRRGERYDPRWRCSKQTGPSPAQLSEAVLPAQAFERTVAEESQRGVRHHGADTSRESQPLPAERVDEGLRVRFADGDQQLVILAATEGVLEGDIEPFIWRYLQARARLAPSSV